jgi:predicted Na+-dependent transporter
MKYALMIAGLIVMCVPETAGFLRFILQGGLGLMMFLGGWALAMEEAKC